MAAKNMFFPTKTLCRYILENTLNIVCASTGIEKPGLSF